MFLKVIKIWMISLSSCSVVGKYYVQWVMSTTTQLYGIISLSNCVVHVYAIYFYSQVQSHLIKFLMLFVHGLNGRYYLKVKFTLMLFFHRLNGSYYLKIFWGTFDCKSKWSEMHSRNKVSKIYFHIYKFKIYIHIKTAAVTFFNRR